MRRPDRRRLLEERRHPPGRRAHPRGGTKFPIAHKRVPEADRRNYNKVMAALTTNQRRGLLDPHIDAARVNWAHLALAQLFATGKVDRVLTVNFDPLLVRACAMAGLFPAIYDLATTERFREAHIAPRSLFYLNGQHTGFVTLNTEDELKRHHQRLRDIVHNTGTRRTWVVVGYSGDADPLLDVLAEREIFEGGLYWVGHDATLARPRKSCSAPARTPSTSAARTPTASSPNSPSASAAFRPTCWCALLPRGDPGHHPHRLQHRRRRRPAPRGSAEAPHRQGQRSDARMGARRGRQGMAAGG
jgi:hypothetical protein